MFSSSIENLIKNFSQLPGVGSKTAQRLVFYLLKQDKQIIKNFGNALLHAQDNIRFCSSCGQFTDTDICSICRSTTRDKSLICIVAESADIESLEKAHEFHGIYHVLHGHINPTENIGPENINLSPLIAKLQTNSISEIILALNPTVEGETTSLYLTKLIKNYPNITLTRLARGLPQGSDLEYADEITLSNAFKGRTKI